jgi:Holliday junction resolvase RusA-like endonuclease
MPHTIYLNVPYVPTSQKRHRHTRGGRTYDPCSEQKRDFLKLCRCISAPPEDAHMRAPVECTLVFTFARPCSHRTSKGVLRKAAPLRHVYKPDADNLAKFVMDALNGVYYKDDSQICALHVVKRYGDEASVRIELEYAS